MSAYKDFTKANERYVASFGEKGKLPLPPAKKLLISESSRSPWARLRTDGRQQSPAWMHVSSEAASVLFTSTLDSQSRSIASTPN